MMETVITAGSIVGGLGLFLLAVSMITEGLKLAAGEALSDMLSRWTGTPARGVASGIVITGLVQSSSAVTVATIGFVNAGFMTLIQALGVIYGANVGTTMTGWLVAAVGFKIKVELFTLPLIGIGMLLRLTGARQRRGAIGMALVGFGLFFIGIDVLKNAFVGMAEATQVQQFSSEGVTEMLMFLATGFLLTLLSQSSSAAIAIILTAATGGVLSLAAAAAMVIGANVGTTSTAALAVIGATPNAKRVAAAHIIFNIVTAFVAILLLPVMLWAVKGTGRLLGMADVPAVTLALFHSTFNVLGVILMMPLTGRLAAFLTTRFRTYEEIEGRPKYLDKTVVVSPELAFKAMCLELARIGGITRRMAKGAMSTETVAGVHLEGEHIAVQNLVQAVEKFITQLERGTLPAAVASELAKVLRTSQYLSVAAELTTHIAKEQISIKPLVDEDLSQAVSQYRAEVVALLEQTDVQHPDFSLEKCLSQLEELEKSYQNVKGMMLEAGAQMRVRIRDMVHTQEQLSRIRRLAEQMVKAARDLSVLFNVTNTEKSSKVEEV